MSCYYYLEIVQWGAVLANMAVTSLMRLFNFKLIKIKRGAPAVAQWVTNPTAAAGVTVAA